MSGRTRKMSSDEEVCEDPAELKRRPALFLDRDGVINVDRAYVCQREHFEFIDEIFAVCRRARELGYLIFVVTNQAGIGRGYYTEEDFLELTDWMCDVFAGEGARIDKVYFCPFHAEHGVGRYKKNSPFRKPGPGMILQAAKEFRVDLPRSILIGDSETDIQAGIAAGVGRNLLYRPRSSITDTPLSTACSVIYSLSDAVRDLERNAADSPPELAVK